MANKFSLNNIFDVENSEKNIENLSDILEVSIEITQPGDKKPSLSYAGEMTRDEVARMLELRKRTLHSFSQKDALTGLMNGEYFDKRMATVDRSQVLPVAIINININDWKFVNDHFGDEESDRLIKTVSSIIVSEAKPYFIIGRIDGDVFGVLIPMALEGEAEDFINKVRNNCDSYEDSILAPSVACGLVYKTNIEQKIEDLMSDAEYEMFTDKYNIKNSAGYRERLERGL